MSSLLQKSVFVLFFSIIPFTAMAAASAWNIVPQDSSLKFTATQNGSPVSGTFKKFSGEINFDPAKLSESKVYIVVDIGSVSTSYADIANTLKTSNWFDVKTFPQATFMAVHFKKTGTNTYDADGTLTIRDKSLPTTLHFVLSEYSKTKAVAKGETSLKRTLFGLGKGEWASTSSIKDDVTVDFVLVAAK